MEPSRRASSTRGYITYWIWERERRLPLSPWPVCLYNASRLYPRRSKGSSDVTKLDTLRHKTGHLLQVVFVNYESVWWPGERAGSVEANTVIVDKVGQGRPHGAYA